MATGTSERTLLRERVLNEITQAILDGTLKPGTRLRDDELIAWLGTSRAPIREALGTLADIGLVEMAPNRYTRVATISPRLYAESTAVWAALVSRGLNWGVRSFPADELPLLESIRDDMRVMDPRDFPPGPTPVDHFMAAILRHCPNQVLLESIAIHAPLLQLGVNTYKGWMEAAPIADFFTVIIDRCARNDADGFEAEIRGFLGGPMTAFIARMTDGYADRIYSEGKVPDADPGR
ncbi:GntR family transcriptional regulator [Frondihabitans australicus]|uniref:DNA-binding GntR family transcriptional regulator n=1 Tax=Frondihabitans australicus TaxID=386892 RepID=A0A495IAB6_9MICO|nr:GntR family transcriptional regulator [Frondihabitans australicus]RKR72957.1 DNA-binding GntR family transcriptional regulator [Frondihabitans australicus]